MTELIFATNNAHKVKEMQAAVGDHFRIITLQEAGIDIEIPEPFSTLEENAAEKSRVIASPTGRACFSEDTGLEVTCLGGAPGVHSARYAGEPTDPQRNMEKLLDEMKGATDRTARFRTVISLRVNGEEQLFEGICEGEILQAESGSGGFGYDPVFRPDGASKSFGDMTLAEKGSYSHRRKASDRLVLYLQHLYATW